MCNNMQQYVTIYACIILELHTYIYILQQQILDRHVDTLKVRKAQENISIPLKSMGCARSIWCAAKERNDHLPGGHFMPWFQETSSVSAWDRVSGTLQCTLQDLKNMSASAASEYLDPTSTLPGFTLQLHKKRPMGCHR